MSSTSAEDPAALVAALVRHAESASKKSERVACIPVLRALSRFGMEGAPPAHAASFWRAALGGVLSFFFCFSPSVSCSPMCRCVRMCVCLCVRVCTVLGQLKSSKKNSEENKAIKLIHYFVQRLAHTLPPPTSQAVVQLLQGTDLTDRVQPSRQLSALRLLTWLHTAASPPALRTAWSTVDPWLAALAGIPAKRSCAFLLFFRRRRRRRSRPRFRPRLWVASSVWPVFCVRVQQPRASPTERTRRWTRSQRRLCWHVPECVWRINPCNPRLVWSPLWRSWRPLTQLWTMTQCGKPPTAFLQHVPWPSSMMVLLLQSLLLLLVVRGVPLTVVAPTPRTWHTA